MVRGHVMFHNSNSILILIYMPFPLKIRGLKKTRNPPTDRRTNGRTDGRTDGPTDQPTDRPTDGRTDGRTDRPSYRDAWTHLKTGPLTCPSLI